MNNIETQQPPQVGGVCIKCTGQEPDLSTEFAPNCTWGSKKRFCELEARSYWSEDVPITDNPYIENTWPWKWFNDEYHQLCA